MTSDASAIVLNAAKTSFDAIHALELDRELITESLNEIRVDIFDLQQKHSQLAEEYITLRDHLNASTISTKRHVNKRYNVSQELKRRIQQIRQLFNFDRFLAVLFENDLKIIAKCNSIVIVNVSDYCCDALIIEKIQIRILRLLHLHISDLRNCTTESLTKSEILK